MRLVKKAEIWQRKKLSSTSLIQRILKCHMKGFCFRWISTELRWKQMWFPGLMNHKSYSDICTALIYIIGNHMERNGSSTEVILQIVSYKWLNEQRPFETIIRTGYCMNHLQITVFLAYMKLCALDL